MTFATLGGVDVFISMQINFNYTMVKRRITHVTTRKIERCKGCKVQKGVRKRYASCLFCLFFFSEN